MEHAYKKLYNWNMNKETCETEMYLKNNTNTDCGEKKVIVHITMVKVKVGTIHLEWVDLLLTSVTFAPQQFKLDESTVPRNTWPV